MIGDIETGTPAHCVLTVSQGSTTHTRKQTEWDIFGVYFVFHCSREVE